MKNNLKSGISLIVLVITIIVVLTLAAAVVFKGTASSEKAEITNFMDDIYKIEDALKGYYIINNKIPTLVSEEGFSLSEIASNYVDASYRGDFEKEVALNKDTSAIFYLVDISKLSVKGFNKGMLQNGNDDVYVVSYPNFNLYYLKGVIYKNDMYFSNSSKLEEFSNKKNEANDTSVIDFESSSGIYIKKNTNEWTNKMGVTIKADVNAGEEVYLKVGSFSSLFAFNTTSGKVDVTFNNFTELNLSPALSIKVTQDAVNNFNENKYLEVIKKKNGEVLDSKKIDLSNYDNVVVGTLNEGDYTYIEYSKFNALSFLTTSFETKGSGVSFVAYEYLTKIDEKGNEVPFYDDVTDYNEEYMLSKAKRMNINYEGIATAKLDKSIKSVKVAVVDRAGNTLLTTLLIDDAHKFVE